MKKFIKSSASAIKAAAIQGTVFYKITERELKDYYSDQLDNEVLRYLVLTYGFETFDIDKLYGSYFDPNTDTLYLCITDGAYIQVGDNTEVNPEEAFDDYSEEELASYIQPVNDEVFPRYLSGYEVNLPDSLETIAIGLLEDGVSFTDVVKGMYDLDMLDDII